MDFSQSPAHSLRRLFAALAVIVAGILALSVDFYPRSFEHRVNLERTRHISQSSSRKQVRRCRFRMWRSRRSITKTSSRADDNASGIAGLLELAHLLGKAGPARPVELVSYTPEEAPHFRTRHMGSVWHASALRAAGRDVEMMLSLEMIGYFSDRPGRQAYPLAALKLAYPDRGNFIALVGQFGDFGLSRSVKGVMSGASELPVYSLNAPSLVQGVDFSEHRSYWTQGYPALMVTDTAFMRNRNYHRAGDTYEKLDCRRMAMVVQAVYAVAKQPSVPE